MSFWGGTAVYAEEPQKFTLDEYVVTATRTELSRKEVPQSVEVITKEDIQNIGCSHIATFNNLKCTACCH